MQEPTQIVIADDHALIRTGLRQVIEDEFGFTVVAEAADGITALEMVRKHQPRVAVLDIEMPGLKGLDAARRIATEKLPTEIIILTMYDDEEMFNEAMDIGVRAYVLKDGASMDIVQAIRSVLRGEYYLSPSLSRHALKERLSKDTGVEKRLGILKLSPSERRILKLVAEQKTSAEIADFLSVSERTVENHRTNICRKLGLSGINALLRFALTHRSEL